MNLLVRINLVLALAFTLAALAVGWACSAMLQENAKQEMLREAYRPEQLQSLERQLAQHIGPMAQHLVKRAAARQPGWEQLITRLADEIDSTPARKQFLDACHALGRHNP